MFLITDGYSNGGDPRPAAEKLKQLGVEFYTFGIRNGNVRELYDMASEPREEELKLKLGRRKIVMVNK